MDKLVCRCKELFFKYKEAILYIFFGGITTLVNIVVYWVMANPLGIDYMISNVAAWVISVLVAFVTNKLFVFESKDFAAKLLLKELALFVGARLFSGALDMGIMYLGIDILKANDLLIKIISNVIVIIVNYILSKLIIFKKPKN